MTELHVFEIESGGSDFVVAESESEAIKLLVEYSGIPAYEYDHSTRIQLLDDKLFPIMKDPYTDCTEITKTCAEWAAENGKGFLASTEW